MSDTICGLKHFHPPHAWGDLNWCPGDPDYAVENEAPELFYAWHPPALDLAAEHGCLDEDIETGDSLACGACITAACVIPPANAEGES